MARESSVERVSRWLITRAEELEAEVARLGPRTPTGHQIDVEAMALDAKTARKIAADLWRPDPPERS